MYLLRCYYYFPIIIGGDELVCITFTQFHLPPRVVILLLVKALYDGHIVAEREV